MNSFLLSALLASNALAVVAAVFWNTESVTVKQGDAVNLTCTVSNVDFMDVVRISFKNSEGQVFTVADNKNVKLPFSSVPRLRVEYYIQNHRGYTTVLYQDIRGEDAGSLLCEKLSDKANSAEVKLHVQVPVKEIYLRLRTSGGWKKLLESDITVFREMQDNELECVAVIEGALTPTDLQISIGMEDRTQFFTASEESKVLKSNDNDLGQYYSEFKLTYFSMNPLREFNGMLLTCTALQDGFNNISTSTMLNVEYGPVIMCSKYEHHARLDDSLTVVCEIDANPVCDSVTWLMDVAGQSGRVTHTLASDDNIQLSETGLSKCRKQVELKIKKIEHMHFTSYHLSAENDLFTAEVTIVLLPASLELHQLPSLHEQKMFFLKQQQLPVPDMVESSVENWMTKSTPIWHLQIFLVVAVFVVQT